MPRSLWHLAVIAIAGLVQGLGWLAPLDDVMRDVRFALDRQPPSDKFAFVEIDSASLESVGVWPWPRRIHAEVLTRLLDLGADIVAFDIDFSTASNAADDALFETALEDAGGYALLAGFRQLSEGGDAAGFTLPLPRFARHADLALVNVATDSTGTVRRVPVAIRMGDRFVPSLPVVLADRPIALDGTEFVIDYAVDPAAIPRISVLDVLSGRVDPALVAGRKIVVGASALELRDVMMTPKHGALPGGLIQLMAAESLLQGRMLVEPPSAQSVALLAALAVVLIALGPVLVTAGGLTAAAGCMAFLEVGALGLQSRAGLLVDTAAPQLALAGCVAVALALEAFEKRRLLREAARQRTEALERLAHLAIVDPLTGVLTRQGFIERVDELAGTDRPMTLMTVGLDRFERINGALGHAVGDLVLKAVANRLAGQQPLALGRTTGESFALAWHAGAAATSDFGRRIAAALQPPVEIEGHEVIVGCHMGAAVATDGTQQAAVLLRRAEIARSLADGGQGRDVVVFETEMEARFDRGRQLELALRNAVRNGDLDIHVQGQVDLQSGQMVGGEALARWTDPALGVISPAQFVPLAEDTGLAVPLGAQILRRACRMATRLPHGFRIAVNVSPAQFELDDVPQLIAAALADSGLDASRLDIEITEGLFLAATGRTIARLNAIRSLGVGIALDDFGTGYSSLAYLASLPIDKLKIDRSFVSRLGREPRVEAVVEHILGLCRKLAITSVAEGIETEVQADWLRRRGCDIGQGFLFHRPAPIDDLLHRLAARERLPAARHVA